MALELHRAQGVGWKWRRKTPLWQQHLDTLLTLMLAVLAVVLLVEVFLLLK